MSAYICSRIKTIEQDCVNYLIALLMRLGCSLTDSLGLFYFMANYKIFRCYTESSETYLTAYVNSSNEIYIGVGCLNGINDQGLPMYDGYTILSKEDAIDLKKELSKLIKEMD